MYLMDYFTIQLNTFVLDFELYLNNFSFMRQNKVHKKEGFEGQKAIVIPRNILSTRCAKNPVIS